MAAINQRSLGIQKENFQKCAKRAAESPRESAGVLVAAHGRVKAEVVLAATREGCVTELVIDDELAEALSDLL